MNISIFTRSLLIIAAMIFAGQVHAVPIHFKFEGMVTSAFFDPDNPFANPVDFGTSISGQYTFDTAAMDQNPSANTGSYSHYGSPFGMKVDIGGNIFSINDFLNISVANDIGSGVDQYSVFAEHGIPGDLDDYLSIQLFLQDDTGMAFANDALPQTASILNSFSFKDFFLDGSKTIDGITYQFQVMGSLDTFSVSEPSSILLIGLGLVGAGFVRRRKKQPDLPVFE